jgi:uncharacterized protein (TIGR00288 family)
LVDSTISSSLTRILTQFRPLLEKIGDIKIAKVILLQQQALEVSNEISQEGFTPIIVHTDLDIHFSLEAMELIYNEKIEVLALATENEKLLPLFSRAKELGKEVVLLLTTKEVCRGLQNAADSVLAVSP